MDSNRQIKLGAVISYAALFINIAITLLYTPWMVRSIGKENYGLYTLAISLISVFLLDFGLSSSVARFIAKYRAEGNTDKQKNFVAAISRLYLFIDIIIAIIFIVIFFFIDRIYTGLTGSELALFKILYVIVAGVNLISFPATPFTGYLNAYEQFASLKICELVNKVLTVLLVVSLLFMGGNVIAVVMANALVGVLVVVLKFYVVRKMTDVRIHFKVSDKAIYREIFSFSIWTLCISIAQRILINTTPSVLAITSSSTEVALFSPALSLEEYFYSIAVAINGLFLPTISRLLAKNEENKILPLMVKVGRYQTCILGLILIGFFCIGNDFMILWMGKDFAPSYYCAIFMMVPQFFSSSQQIGYTTITAKGYVKYQAAINLATAIIGACLSYWWSLTYGALGSCIALFMMCMVNMIGVNVILVKKFHLKISIFYRDCYLRMMTPFVVTAVVGYYISNVLIPQVGILLLCIKGIIVVGIYISLMWFLSFNAEEKSFVLRIPLWVKSRIRK